MIDARGALKMLLILALGLSGCATPPSAGGYIDVEGSSVSDPSGMIRGTLVEQAGAGSADLSPGDVILTVDDREVPRYADLVRTAFDVGANRAVSMAVARGDERHTVTVRTVSAEERAHVGFGLPLLQPPLSSERGGIGLDSLWDLELGPDEKGFMLFRLLGYESGPRGWDARLLIFHFGRQIDPTLVRERGEAGRTEANGGGEDAVTSEVGRVAARRRSAR